MKKLLFLLSALTTFISNAQDLTCADFKNGKFLIPADSLVSESYVVTRDNGKQIEIDENGNKIQIDIKYIDNCNYILTYNPNSQNLDDLARYINASGGVRIKVKKIKGDTLSYIGVIKNDSIYYEMPGKLIKIE